MNAQTSFATVMQVLAAHRYAVALLWGARVEATYYGADGATFAVGDRVFCEWAAGSQLWTISGELWAISARNRGGDMHDPVTLGTGSDAALALAGQQLTLADVLTPAEHTAIGDSAPHHAAVTLAADAEVLLGLSTQQLTLDSQNANTVLAGPATGAAADPTFRALVADDLPSHGAAAHTNRTRNLWLPAKAFDILGGAPTLAPVHAALGIAWLFDDTANEFLGTTFIVPEDWASGVVVVKTYYSMAGNNAAHVVVLQILAGSFANGEACNTYDFVTDQAFTVPTTANTLDIRPHDQTLTVAAGEMIQMRFARNSGHAEDTAVGDLQFLGMELEYTADM